MTDNDSTKTAVVTGAGRGLGLEFARQLVARGFRVLGTVRGAAPALEEVGATPLPLDVSDAGSIASLGARVGEHTQRVDLQINNAGINSRGVPAAQGNVRFGELEQPAGAGPRLRPGAARYHERRRQSRVGQHRHGGRESQTDAGAIGGRVARRHRHADGRRCRQVPAVGRH